MHLWEGLTLTQSGRTRDAENQLPHRGTQLFAEQPLLSRARDMQVCEALLTELRADKRAAAFVEPMVPRSTGSATTLT